MTGLTRVPIALQHTRPLALGGHTFTGDRDAAVCTRCGWIGAWTRLDEAPPLCWNEQPARPSRQPRPMPTPTGQGQLFLMDAT